MPSLFGIRLGFGSLARMTKKTSAATRMIPTTVPTTVPTMAPVDNKSESDNYHAYQNSIQFLCTA